MARILKALRWSILGAHPRLRLAAAGVFALIVLNCALEFIDPEHYTPGWGLALFIAIVEPLAVVAIVLSTRRRAAGAERALEISQIRSRSRATRIATLRQVAGVQSLDPDERLRAIVSACCVALRPHHSVFGYASQAVGETLAIDAVAAIPSEPVAWQPSNGLTPGAHIPLHDTLEGTILTDGATIHWSSRADLPKSAYLATAGAVLIHAFRIGAITHFITLCCAADLTDDPFTDDDVALVEVIATFLGHEQQHRWQLDRLRYQMEHDSVTGLPNRVMFRRSVVPLLSEERPFAILVADLDRFRELTNQHGQLFGDEVLVEVATGLQGINKDAPTFRLTGDQFVVLLRDVADEAELLIRVLPYRELFFSPFHTGDRAGTRMANLDASFGTALFPHDGKTLDTLMRAVGVTLNFARRSDNAALNRR